MKNEPIDKKLYNKIKKEADKKFTSPTSAYKSSWIVREYKKRGGKYKGSKSKSSGLTRWYKEKWIDLNRPIKENGKIVGYKECGRKSSKSGTGAYPTCRPSKRVSTKTPKTYRELPRKQLEKARRTKIKIKSKGRVQFGSGQFHGKRSSVMVKVPKDVASRAKKAFRLRELGFKGGIETGWKRAKQLATKKEISIQDLRYMRNWFARHYYTSRPVYIKWARAGKPETPEWFNKRGIIAWLIWGGDPALKWINSKTNLLNKHFNKNYKQIGKKFSKV